MKSGLTIKKTYNIKEVWWQNINLARISANNN